MFYLYIKYLFNVLQIIKGCCCCRWWSKEGKERKEGKEAS